MLKQFNYTSSCIEIRFCGGDFYLYYIGILNLVPIESMLSFSRLLNFDTVLSISI